MKISDLLKWLKKDKKPKKTAQQTHEPVFFISAAQVWSAHVESYLEERGIPYLKEGRKGPALALELGYTSEIFDYYIPREALEDALEGAGELREITGG